MKKSILFTIFMAIFSITSFAETPQEILRSAIAEVNATLPGPEDDGMQLRSVMYENNTIVYLICCNESVVGNDFINILNDNKDLLLPELKRSYLDSNPDAQAFKQLVTAAKADVAFKFKGVPSGKLLVLTIKYTQL